MNCEQYFEIKEWKARYTSVIIEMNKLIDKYGEDKREDLTNYSQEILKYGQNIFRSSISSSS